MRLHSAPSLLPASLCAAALLIGASTGCSGSKTDDTAGSGDSASADDSGSPEDSGEADGALTFESCVVSVAADVPAFYQKYFRCVELAMSGADVAMVTASLPPYDTYYYGPDSANYAPWDDQGGTTSPNPNYIAAQNVAVLVPSNPVAKGLTIDGSLVDLQAGTSAEEYQGGPVGISPDSVSAYNATAAPGDDILEEQYTFDEWGAHPDQRGSYHHHQANRGALAALLSAGLVTTDVPGEAEVEVYGMMCDGTVLLGCTELDGTPVDASALDAQNGHVGDVVDADGTAYFTERYHTHMCEALGNHALAPEIQYYETCGVGAPR